MSDILVRNLDARIVNRLKAIAKSHGRSLQAQVKAILTDTVSMLSSQAVTVSESWQKSLKGKKHSDSAIILREDRNR